MASQGEATPLADAAPFRVLVVEDNPTFRMQIEVALAHLGAGEPVAFSMGKDALDWLDSASAPGVAADSAPDMALVDIGLPDMSGIDVIRELRSRMPELAILVISVIKSEQTLLDAIRAGARGYILKGENEEAIAHAIGEVRRGNYPISPALARSLFQLAGAPEGAAGSEAALAATTRTPYVSGPALASSVLGGAGTSGGASGVGAQFQLTPREREVLHLIARGLTYLEVAAELSVSLSTIQTYVRGLYRKLQVHNRLAAVNKGRAAGVL